MVKCPATKTLIYNLVFICMNHLLCIVLAIIMIIIIIIIEETNIGSILYLLRNN